MSIFDCDKEWPVCLFDFTFKSKVPTQIVLKIARPLDECLVDGYFYGKPEFQKTTVSFRDDLVIER